MGGSSKLKNESSVAGNDKQAKGMAAAPVPASLMERVRCLVHLSILGLLTGPISVLLTLIWSIPYWLRALVDLMVGPGEQPASGDRKTVLVTGGKMSKSLHFARCLWKAGHRVILTETPRYWCSGSRFSRAVHAFETVRSPRTDPKGYVDDLVAIAKKHKVDVFLPVSAPVESVYDARVKEILERTTNAKGMNFTKDFTHLLDCKHQFGSFCKDNGLTAPETFLLLSNEEAHEHNERLSKLPGEPHFILKNLEYDAIHRLDLFKLPTSRENLQAYLDKIERDGNPIQPNHPWQLQEFVHGKEYSAMSVLRSSRLAMITVGESSPSQLNYVALQPEKSVPAKLIIEWVSDFVKALPAGINGSVCFDFIHDERSNRVYVLECNPRAHSQSCVFSTDAEQRLLGHILATGGEELSAELERSGPLRPSEPLRQLHWTYNEALKLIPNNSIFKYNADGAAAEDADGLRGFLRRVVMDWDADFDAADPLPFIMRNHFQLPILLTNTLRSGNQWKKCDFCIGKIVEVGGD